MRGSHYLGEHTALTTTRFGDKIFVDTRDTSLAPHILVDGDWESWVTNAFGHLLTMPKYKGAVVIDVGANFGWYTLLACRLGASKVYALEPQERLFSLLRRSVAVNGYTNVAECWRLAAGSQTTPDNFVEFSWEELGGGSVIKTVMAARSAKVIESVLTKRLDEVVSVDVGAPVLMKVDVEGHEVEVLRGAPNVLRAKPLLFVEHHQANTSALFELIGAQYDIRLLRHSGHQSPVLTADEARTIPDAETLLCMPKDTG